MVWCASMCVYVCVCVCVCVFGNSENVQTVCKVCKLMYCAIVQMCVHIFWLYLCQLRSFVFILAYEVCLQVC